MQQRNIRILALLAIMVLVAGLYYWLPFWHSGSKSALPLGVLANMEVGNDGSPRNLQAGGVLAFLYRQREAACSSEGQFMNGVGSMTEVGRPCDYQQLALAPLNGVRPDKLMRDPVTYMRKNSSVEVFTLAGYAPDVPNAAPVNQMSIIRLDPENPVPQALVGGYSGGAHCCETVWLFWRNKEKWEHLELSTDQDGDRIPPVLTLPGTDPVMSLEAPGFAYSFASYAGSYTPPRFVAFSRGMLEDVTHQPQYRPLLLAHIRKTIGGGMDDGGCSGRGNVEPNGFLAYYTAMLALLGHFPESWAYTLLHYDHRPRQKDDPIDKKAFIHDLRETLHQNGYITDQDYNSAPLSVEQLSAEEQARFAPPQSLFSMLPDSDALYPAQAALCAGGTIGP